MIVRKLREQRNWSQENLAEHAALSLRTIQRVEAGNRASLETLKSLASVFDVNINQLKEDIIVIDKQADTWKSEPLFVRFFLIGIRKRAHMQYLEYGLLLMGICSWIFISPLDFITPLVFVLAYGNAKLINYIDHKQYWHH